MADAGNSERIRSQDEDTVLAATAATAAVAVKEPEKEEPGYWNMPHRNKIFMLVVCRITEPIAYSSVSPYLYYMIRDFGYSDPSEISALSTLVMASFALGQTLTSVWWGRFSDTFGRKPALILGLTGAAFSILLFGLSTNVYMAMLARTLAGLLNGNVGVLRTMVAELIGDHKEFQSRAFSIMPITMNIGMIIGPMLGGMLANPTESLPWLFGGSELLKRHPYLLPNLIPLPLFILSILFVVFFIEETLTGKRVMLPAYKDPGLKIGNKIKQRIWPEHRYTAVSGEEADHFDDDVDLSDVEEEDHHDHTTTNREQHSAPAAAATAPTTQDDSNEPKYASIRSILTRKVKITLTAYSILMLHAPAFMQLFPLFLSTPKMENSHKNFLMFNGGLGLPTSKIGLIMSGLGFVGIFLQLVVYPRLAAWLGNAGVHKAALYVFPGTYLIIPYLAFVPTSPPYVALFAAGFMAAVAVMGRTFAIPPMGVLVTNASPSRSVLGTLMGLTQSTTSAARCIGPFVLGNVYSLGVKVGMVGLAWWTMLGITIVEIIIASRLKEWGSEEDVEEDEENASS